MAVRDPVVLEQRLNDFDPNVRRDALAALAALSESAWKEPGGNVNLHVHSFFSYNAQGWSPSRIAWEARKSGWYAAGLCDFDVLDGLDEFLAAGRTLGLRTAVHLETRAFLRAQAAVEINSPGEPGVSYVMGGGFFAVPAGPAAEDLSAYRRAARERNEALVVRINARLPRLGIDYGRDVLPRTPAGVATERHIVAAYVDRAAIVLRAADARAAFWAPVLGLPAAEAARLEEADRPAFEERVRGALAKRGGLGYVQPDERTFPPAEDFIGWVRRCGAIPLATWLDGTSEGERDARGLLGALTELGCAGVNVIPDRNWNLPRPADRALKTARLAEIVAAARGLDLPINVGTEMNRPGLPAIDDLDGPVLREHRAAFLEGARVFVGHTVLATYADMPYLGPRAGEEFPGRRARNAFYAAVGALPPLTAEMADRLLDAGPERARRMLREAAAKH
jgi:hypothetical protein